MAQFKTRMDDLEHLGIRFSQNELDIEITKPMYGPDWDEIKLSVTFNHFTEQVIKLPSGEMAKLAEVLNKYLEMINYGAIQNR